MDAIWNLFATLNASTGINLPYLYDAFERSRFFAGIGHTILLVASCMAASVVLGAIGALVQIVWPRVGRFTVDPLIKVFRNTPPIIQLYFFYFAIGNLLPKMANAAGQQEPLIDALGWTIISLSVYTAAFNVESFRAGIEAVPRTMIEAAEALCCRPSQIFLKILLPLGMRFSLPSLTNNLVDLVKQTSLAYAIAVPELLYVSSQIWADEFNVKEMMFTLLLVYTALVAVVVAIMHVIERKLSMPGYQS
ncbi:amino acid ABC transporter permease [Noviherbaspirillum sp.]|uniref:amino acid ABC transporter permease n=1 Tax=Noviherbaspirillum sp. TaxID=1926288 RepID=UPI002B460F4F|nr:amino acid ABC transporter permease [Noviherbaspirillum sp.]HJV82382.1 amino acid ABC transporter permease [Noviherbaspirillum sp.]